MGVQTELDTMERLAALERRDNEQQLEISALKDTLELLNRKIVTHEANRKLDRDLIDLLKERIDGLENTISVIDEMLGELL